MGSNLQKQKNDNLQKQNDNLQKQKNDNLQKQNDNLQKQNDNLQEQKNDNLHECIKLNIDNTELKKLTPFDKDIKLVSKPNDFDEYDDDPDVLRAVLSCGHVIDPNSLTDYCRAQLKDGLTEFKCLLCKKEWPYDEVRKLAKLTTEEQLRFEKKLGKNTVNKIVDFRHCPGCGTFVQRLDVSNLCVQCSICTLRNRKIYQFCWQCLREWKGSQNRADRCDNEGCSIDPKLLRDCPMITLTFFRNVVQCPKLRKCPSCDTLIEHTKIGCNNIKCPQCNNEFCFICLKPGHFDLSNPCTIAPRQINALS